MVPLATNIFLKNLQNILARWDSLTHPMLIINMNRSFVNFSSLAVVHVTRELKSLILQECIRNLKLHKAPGHDGI